ncbi:unnamed protein product, partial [Rotaria magnacalcarata]
ILFQQPERRFSFNNLYNDFVSTSSESEKQQKISMRFNALFFVLCLTV